MSFKRMLAWTSVVATVAFATAAILASGALAAASLGGPACTSPTKHVANCSASYSGVKLGEASCTYTFTNTKSGASESFAGTITAGSVKDSGTCSVSASLAKGGNYTVDIELDKKGAFAASSSGFLKVK
jgi:hypothetical protein